MTNTPLITALLYEHEDGRYAVNPNTTGDPGWHRLGPVDLGALAAQDQEAGPALPLALKTHGAWDGLEGLDDLPDGTEIYAGRPPRSQADAPAAPAAVAPQGVEPGALAQSIRELDAWEDRADGEALTPSECESVMLVLRELKRPRSQPADDMFELWWAEHMPKATQSKAWAAWIDATRAAPALGAPAAIAAPDNWKLVPTGRATMTMVLAASQAHAKPSASYSDLWAAMVAAAPQAPAEAQEPVATVQKLVGRAPSIAWRQRDIAMLPDGTPLYTHPAPQQAAPQAPAAPADGLAADVEAVLTLLEEKEWAEHCTKTPLGQRLEAAITEMHNEIHEAEDRADSAAPAAPSTHAGLRAAAEHIQTKANAYAEECGSYDPDTGAFEMRDAVQEYFNILDELAEEIRLLVGKAAPASCDKPPAGWTCSRAYGHDGPCAAAPAAPAVDALAERDAAFEAVRNWLCGLQRYSFVLDDDGVVRRTHDRTGNWIEFDAVDAALAAQAAAKAAKGT